MFRSLALGGGGMRGGLHIGALRYLLERQGHLTFPDGIYGVSVGAIVATAVAFNVPLPILETMMNSHMGLSAIIPDLRLDNVSSLLRRKGLFSMDKFEQNVISAFELANIDVRNTKIGDAPQKLYIGVSNLTSRKPAFLTGDVPLLLALRCSCCLPLIFEPQVLYKNLYCDGGVYFTTLHNHVPKDALTIHIINPPSRMFPESLESFPVSEMIRNLYTARCRASGANTLWLNSESIGTLQELSIEDKKHLTEEGYLQTARLLTERFPEKLE